MIVAWIAFSIIIAVGLAFTAVVFDVVAEKVEKRERPRVWIRRLLLLEATEYAADALDRSAHIVFRMPNDIVARLHKWSTLHKDKFIIGGLLSIAAVVLFYVFTILAMSIFMRYGVPLIIMLVLWFLWWFKTRSK